MGDTRLQSSGTALATALCLFSSPASGDEVVTVEHEQFTVTHMSSLPAAGVDEISGRVDDAIRRVSAWLGQSEYWQKAYADQRIRVLIDPDKHTPTQIRSTIFVPEGRVRLAVENDALEQGDFGIVHEITHVLAASAYRPERNRFYDDGLAVFLQHKFGPPANYPTLGIDLHLATARLQTKQGGLIAFADADQARRVTDNPDRRRLGYLQLGSFTQYLVERFGLDAYMRIYGGAPIEDVTGRSLDELEVGWQALINSIQ